MYNCTVFPEKYVHRYLSDLWRVLGLDVGHFHEGQHLWLERRMGGLPPYLHPLWIDSGLQGRVKIKMISVNITLLDSEPYPGN